MDARIPFRILRAAPNGTEAVAVAPRIRSTDLSRQCAEILKVADDVDPRPGRMMSTYDVPQGKKFEEAAELVAQVIRGAGHSAVVATNLSGNDAW